MCRPALGTCANECCQPHVAKLFAAAAIFPACLLLPCAAEDKNKFKVVLPDQLLESVFSGYYEIYMYEFACKDEVKQMNTCLYNLGTRAVLLRMLQEQAMFDVRMVYDKRQRSNGGADYELVLEFHRRAPPNSPRLSAPC